MQGMDVAAREAVMDATRALVGLAARSVADVGADVSLVQFRVLVLLEGRGAQPMGELAAHLDVNPSTVTRVCDVLVDKQLIRRRVSSGNRRSVCAELTAKGRRLMERVLEERRRLVDEALAGLSTSSKRRLTAALADLSSALAELSDEAWTLGWHLGESVTLP